MVAHGMAIFQSPKIFSEAKISRKIPVIPQKERFSSNLRRLILKIQSPKKMQFHTPAIPYPTRLPPNFSGDFLGVFDFLRIACSLGIPLEYL